MSGPIGGYSTHLEPGDRTTVYGPYGKFSEPFFSLGKDCVFIGGGIGITPFIGMWHVALHSEERMRSSEMDRILKLKHPEISSGWKTPKVALFYLCKNRTEASFDDEILAEVASSPLGDMEKARLAGYEYILHESQIHGRFGMAQIEKVIGNQFATRLFFLCGPTPHDGSDQYPTARQERTPARHLRRGLQPRVRPKPTLITIITVNPHIVSIVAISVFFSNCDSGISSSTTTKREARAADARCRDMDGTEPWLGSMRNGPEQKAAKQKAHRGRKRQSIP